MSWTYSGDPSNSLLDQVRFLVADTNADDPQITDEEIAWLLSEASNNVYLAAANAARSLGAKFSSYVDSRSVGDLSISYSSRAQRMYDLAKQLDKKAAITLCPPYAGGISVSDKESVAADTDRVAPAFRRGMHDFTSTVNDPESSN